MDDELPDDVVILFQGQPTLVRDLTEEQAKDLLRAVLLAEMRRHMAAEQLFLHVFGILGMEPPEDENRNEEQVPTPTHAAPKQMQ